MASLLFKIKFRYKRWKNQQDLRRCFNNSLIGPIKEKNRQVLTTVENWMTDEIYDHSIFQYGIPASIRPLINQPIDHSITYTDIFVYLMGKLHKPVSYLEIGVSAGKNFFQIVSSITNSRATGMDIESINPVLEKKFVLEKRLQWPSNSSLKKTESSMSTYSYNGNEITYLCSDEFDENGWKKLKGEEYNAIFSDALHTPDALAFEFSMLKKV